MSRISERISGILKLADSSKVTDKKVTMSPLLIVVIYVRNRIRPGNQIQNCLIFDLKTNVKQIKIALFVDVCLVNVQSSCYLRQT